MPEERHDQLLVQEDCGWVRVLTLNRPSVRNALSGPLIQELRAAIAEADADESIRVVVLTGADPAFCAGVDLTQLERPGQEWGGDWDAIEDAVPHGQPWRPISKPIIGAINGAAVTAGLEIALACDLLIASEHARFADTHGSVGVVPGWGLTARLPTAVGYGLARRMSLTGEFLSAPQALAAGLVTEVVPHAHLREVAMTVANEIAARWESGGRVLHQIYRTAQSEHLTVGLSVERHRFEAWVSGADMSAQDPEQSES